MFSSVFNGATTIYGIFEKGEHKTALGTIRQDDYDMHLKGEKSIGVCPVLENRTCVFGCIDLDLRQNYSEIYEPSQELVASAWRHGFVPFFSKSKNIHIFRFEKGPILEEEMRGKLLSFGRSVGLVKGCDVYFDLFPDEDRWVNLPYFGNSRKAIGPDLKEISAWEEVEKLIIANY